MTYIDTLLRTERQYEHFDEMTKYAHTLAALLEMAREHFPIHAQQLETMQRDAIAANDAARDAIEFDL